MKRYFRILTGIVWLGVLFVLLPGCKNRNPTQPTNGNSNPDNRQPADLYVSPHGSDSNSGTSSEEAFKTLTKALQVAQPGDIIEVLPGTYSEEIELNTYGSTQGSITIRGVSQSERPIFNGMNTMKTFLYCYICTNMVFQDLIIQNYRWDGIYIDFGKNLSFARIHFEHIGFDISDNPEAEGGEGLACTECKNILISENSFKHIGKRTLQKDSSGNAIDLWGSTDSRVERNFIEATEGTGILIEDSCSITVSNNTIRTSKLKMNEWFDAGIWVDGGINIIVENNVLEKNEGPGIEVSDTEIQYPNRSRAITIRNNSLRTNDIGIYMWNFGVCPPPEDAVHIEGNDFSANTENIRCHDWECGPHTPCVEPDRVDPC